MTQDQEAVYEAMQEEYWQYLENLEAKSKNEIISESDRTQFYAGLVMYLGERTLTAKQIDALDTPDVLNKLYTDFLANNLDSITRADIGAKVIYGFTKRQSGLSM